MSILILRLSGVSIDIGTAIEVPVIWELADLFNGLMIFPNLIAIILMSKLVKEKLMDYES